MKVWFLFSFIRCTENETHWSQLYKITSQLTCLPPHHSCSVFASSFGSLTVLVLTWEGVHYTVYTVYTIQAHIGIHYTAHILEGNGQKGTSCLFSFSFKQPSESNFVGKWHHKKCVKTCCYWNHPLNILHPLGLRRLGQNLSIWFPEMCLLRLVARPSCHFRHHWGGKLSIAQFYLDQHLNLFFFINKKTL